MEDDVYSNIELCALLGIDHCLLKKYRDNGLISYHRVGDKYWYRGTDVNEFLNDNKFEA